MLIRYSLLVAHHRSFVVLTTNKCFVSCLVKKLSARNRTRSKVIYVSNNICCLMIRFHMWCTSWLFTCTHLVVGNLPIKSLVARQWQTNTYTCMCINIHQCYMHACMHAYNYTTLSYTQSHAHT